MPTLARLVTASLLVVTLSVGTPALAAGKSSDPIPADQIEQLVAPIALYPDALVAQILMASTYPLDVVQANRWLKDHEDLKGEALDKAVKEEAWDASVKALVYFPSVLAFMSDNLDWTQDLGDAVLAQEGELTDTIQRLRREADKAGALATNEQQRVEKAGDTIVIQPAQPETVYVPVYDPVKVYGQSAPPAKSYYPDAYADAASSYTSAYPSGTVVPSSTVVYPTTTEVASSGSDNDALIGFGAGALVGGLLTAAIMWDDNDNDRLYYGGPGYYGGGSYWSQPNYWNNNGWRNPSNIQVNRNIDMDRTVNRGDITVNKGIVGNDVKKWEHNPERRGGVRYRDSSTENRFAAARNNGNVSRDEARGRAKGGDRQLKAPDLGTVRAEGAASGKLAQGAGDRRQGGGQVADLKDRQGPGGGQAANLRDRPAGGGDARPKAKDRAQARPAAKPRVQGATANKRPVNREAKRPAAAQSKRPAAAQVQRPAKSAQRPAARPSAPQGGAFKGGGARMDRAASNRGGASRAAAGRSQSGAARGGGGGGGGARGGGGGGRGGGRR